MNGALTFLSEYQAGWKTRPPFAPHLVIVLALMEQIKIRIKTSPPTTRYFLIDKVQKRGRPCYASVMTDNVA